MKNTNIRLHDNISLLLQQQLFGYRNSVYVSALILMHFKVVSLCIIPKIIYTNTTLYFDYYIKSLILCVFKQWQPLDSNTIIFTQLNFISLRQNSNNCVHVSILTYPYSTYHVHHDTIEQKYVSDKNIIYYPNNEIHYDFAKHENLNIAVKLNYEK